MSRPVRVRFAPSPTGALHIGGVRTALYNYLWAKKQGGTFILRIEDTDQKRYVSGAEDYLMEALEWLGVTPDESPAKGGEYGPYRQSERKDMYAKFAEQMINAGYAYYAFDTPEELEAMRKTVAHGAKYDATTRMTMTNALTLSEEALAQRLASNDPNQVIRIKIPANEEVVFHDMIRGEVRFSTNTMDDKVLLKPDGMPTYHLANIVDDYHMKISHVVRGEEWLPSTPLHVLLYRYLGWEDAMPTFAHLPLILRPTGKGKLSKRDGSKFGMPVFPLDWNADNPEDSFKGFREWGFLPEAVLNFLLLLGWSASDDEEIMSLERMVELFDLADVNKAGARFDFDKARWFNQQYIMKMEDGALAQIVHGLMGKDTKVELNYVQAVCGLMKERVAFLPDFLSDADYFFNEVDLEAMKQNEAKNFKKRILKKWNAEYQAALEDFGQQLSTLTTFDLESLTQFVAKIEEETTLHKGSLFPVLRLSLSGSMKGPGVLEMIEVLGKEKVVNRLNSFINFVVKEVEAVNG